MIDEKDEKLWATLCHLSALVGFVFPVFGNIVGPLVFWILKKDQMPLVDVNGKEALNFQISMSIYALVAAALVWVLIGIPLLFMIALADLILIVMASVKTSEGTPFRYPLTIRLIK
jgi:uncharacterized Tic20 family protein